MENATVSIEERGRSKFGRVYKRRECTSCENCNHGETVDGLGDKLAAVLTLHTAPVTAAVPVTAGAHGHDVPKADAPVTAASEPAAVSRAAVKKKEAKGLKTGGKTAAAPRIRAPLARKASNKIDTEAAAPPADSVAPMKKAPVEKKDTEAVKKNERKSTKPVPQEKKKVAKDDKENRPRASTRKVRSVTEI